MANADSGNTGSGGNSKGSNAKGRRGKYSSSSKNDGDKYIELSADDLKELDDWMPIPFS